LGLWRLVEVTTARNRRTSALCATVLSLSSLRAKNFSRLPPLFLILFVTCSSSLDGQGREDLEASPTSGNDGPAKSLTSISIPLTWILYFLKMTYFELICYKPRKGI
jgi:hypothetical protein